MNYKEVVEKLFSRHRSVQSAGFSPEAYKPGLDAMREYARQLGNPQERFRSIHVAGTNGKGSVCSMLAAALAAKGLRTGLYTSPHLIDFRERIKIVTSDGYSLISEEAVCEFLQYHDREGLTFFEVTTGLAFWWFAQAGVDVAVIETGLGGLLDSTNIITPEISLITSIGLDHCDLLGNIRAEVAFQKAGIFKSGVPALVWGRDPETQPVFGQVAAAAGAPLYFAEDFRIPAGFPPLDLAGPCQDINLRTVCAALSILYGGRMTAKVKKAIAGTAALTGFRGRWEVLRRNPLVICDIAHNPPALAYNFSRLDAMRSCNLSFLEGACTEKLRCAHPSQPGGWAPPVHMATGSHGFSVAGTLQDRPLLIVFGVMADKDIDGIVPLLPRGAEIFPVQPHTPRALSLNSLALKLKQFCISPQPSVARGVEAALTRAEELEDAIIYIGGSTYVVSEAISYFQSV